MSVAFSTLELIETRLNGYSGRGYSFSDIRKIQQKEKREGPTRDRTGIAGIRNQSDDHYTIEP